MWTLWDRARGANLRVDRRSFIAIGAAGLGGLTLPDMLRAEEFSGKQKAVINIHLDGGPPHMDLIDPKPHAPAEVRGEFSPISTTIPGVQLTELMPRLAGSAEKFVFIRSLVGSAGQHHAFQCPSGFDEKSLATFGGRPALGCVVSKLHGKPDDAAPAFVDLMQGRPLVRNSARPGFLGPAYKPFRPDLSAAFARPLETGMKNELAKLGSNHSTPLSLGSHLTLERLSDRTHLLSQMDRLRRDVDGSGMMSALDRFQQQAVGILTSGRLAEALDLSAVGDAELSRYTAQVGAPGAIRSTTSEDGSSVRKFLIARRLIEAGVRCVSVSISDFDTHSSNFPRMRHLGPIVDFGLHALVTDLDERGMLDDVSIVVWGEFGRTPQVDSKKGGGRHHWPLVGMAIMAGGGIRSGQVIGVTDRTAAAATRRPVSYPDVFATLYQNLGIRIGGITIPDPTGRPQYLVVNGQPMAELG